MHTGGLAAASWPARGLCSPDSVTSLQWTCSGEMGPVGTAQGGVGARKLGDKARGV